METLCEKCQAPLTIGSWPFCPHGTPRGGVIGDDIPGGVLIHHGVCNEDGTPKRYYTRSSIVQAATDKGLFQGYDTPKVANRLSDQRAEAIYKKAKAEREGSY